MGACASFPRGLKPAEASEAPAPEPAPEQSVKDANVESTDEVKLEHDKKNDDEAKQPSLGSLLDENEAIDGKKANEEVAAKTKDEEQQTAEAPTTQKKTDEIKDSMEKNEKDGKKDK